MSQSGSDERLPEGMEQHLGWGSCWAGREVANIGKHRIEVVVYSYKLACRMRFVSRLAMAQNFSERPILNPLYAAPSRHHPLDKEGRPLDLPHVEGRRESKLTTPILKHRKKKKTEQQGFDLGELGLSSKDQEYNPAPIINEIRLRAAFQDMLAIEEEFGKLIKNLAHEKETA